MDPMNGVWVASFADQQETIDRADVVLLDPFALVILFFHNTDTCRGHVKTRDSILLNSVPNDTWVWHNWLAFEEDTGTASKEWPVNDETVPYNPTNITASEMNRSLVDIED